jgi:hypothetical protein
MLQLLGDKGAGRKTPGLGKDHLDQFGFLLGNVPEAEQDFGMVRERFLAQMEALLRRKAAETGYEEPSFHYPWALIQSGYQQAKPGGGFRGAAGCRNRTVSLPRAGGCREEVPEQQMAARQAQRPSHHTVRDLLASFVDEPIHTSHQAAELFQFFWLVVGGEQEGPHLMSKLALKLFRSE